MSTENVEIVRRGYEALNQGDIQTTLALFDPRVEVHLAKEGQQVLGPDFSPVYSGLDGFMEFLGQLQAAWEKWSWEPEEYIDAGDDRVLVMLRMRAKGRASGLEVDQPMGHLCTMEDGRLVRHETYWDPAEAREAAGVPPSG
jgi:ketosteroid isomerase-like protein